MVTFEAQRLLQLCFLTRDPIGLEGGINLYAYVGNGVVIGKDPSGTVVIAPFVGIILRQCAVGIAGGAAEQIGEWLACVLYRGIMHGRAGIRTCGPFPVPSLCDVIGGCIGGILGGELLKKLLPPNIKDEVLELLSEIVGAFFGGGFGSGLCDEVRQDPPRLPVPKPAPPVPHPPSPSPGQGGCGPGGYIPRPSPPPAV